MKKLLSALLFSSVAASAQVKADLAFSKIPPELLLNAHAVVRDHTVAIDVKDRGAATVSEHRVVTLLDDRAEGYTDLDFGYSKIWDIDDLDGAVYDADGQLVRRLKKKDILDEKQVAHLFIDDTRVKRLRFPRRAFPFTVEYTVRYKLNGMMHLPVFRPQESSREAVERADFRVWAPAGATVRVHENDAARPAREGSEMHWHFEKLTASAPEDFAPVGSLGLPEVICAPTDFSIEGFDGNMESWQNYGLFQLKLNENRQKLPDATVAMLRQLTADCPGDRCRAERVYRHLQETTRYFYIGLGLGGWQPAPAEQVDALKYGDCKGLSNYLVAMLAAVGVEARYVVVRAGAEAQEQYADFPNANFNHIIACVPQTNDTIWLECTSQSMPFGFLGDFTDDRPALLVAPDGGHIVRTPRYDETVNRQVTEAEIALSETGDARLRAGIDHWGNFQDIPAQLTEFDRDFQKKYLDGTLAIRNFEIDSLGFVRIGGRRPHVLMNLELNLPGLGSTSGRRMFLPANVFSGVEVPALPEGPRRLPVQADSRGLTKERLLKIALPPGFSVESLPEAAHLSSDFGTFDFEAKLDGGRVSITRKLVLNNRILPPDRYPDLIGFLKKAAAADRSKLVLVRS